MRRALVTTLVTVLLTAGVVTAPAHAAATIEPGPRTYQYLIPTSAGDPIRWLPCDPVTWKLAPGRSTARQQATLTAAVAEVARATGLDFSYAGTTSTPISSLEHAEEVAQSEGVDVIVAFLAPTAENGLGGYAAGFGGFQASGPYARAGGVIIDQQAIRRMNVRAQTTLYLHELGHLVGLDHVRGPNIMTPGRYSVHAFSANDLAGLQAVGRHGDDCVGGTATPPGPITSPQITPQPDGSLLVTWTPTGGWAATYAARLSERTGGSGFSTTATVAVPRYTISAARLAEQRPGSTLTLTITGTNAAGTGADVTIPVR